MKNGFFAILCFFILISQIMCWPAVQSDALPDELLARVYRTVLLKAKRSPSIGLSLAEYMANPQGQDNFHFIPNGRK